MKISLLPFVFASALSSSAFAAETIGKIGDIEVKTDEIREALAGLESSTGAATAKDPAAVGQYVRALLIQKLVLQELLQKKWDQDPAVIEKLVRSRESVLTESYLEANSKVSAGYPSDSELQAAYDAAKPNLVTPKSFRLAQIFVAVPKDADKASIDKAKAKVDATAKRLKEKNADFSAIAAAQSEEPASRDKGGEIGWVAEAQIQPEIRELLPKFAAGNVSDPVKLSDGWHILKVLEVKEAGTASLEQVKDRLVVQLRTEKARQNRQAFLATLLKDHPLAVNEIEIGKLLSKP